MHLTRRSLFQAGLGTAGALVAGRSEAQGAERSTVVIVNLTGGLHSLFGQADCFVSRNAFGCTGSNTRDVGNGVVVDNATFGTLEESTLRRMCNVGVFHGISAHDVAQKHLLFDSRGRSFPLQLANAMSADSPVACANVGVFLPGFHEAIGSASVQKISDASGVLAALGAQPGGEFVPSRATALAGLRGAVRLSSPTLSKNQRSLVSLTNGLTSVVRALATPPVPLDWSEIAQTYGFSPSTTLISGFASQFAAAELLIRAGTSVILVNAYGPACTLGWDTHEDPAGLCAREGMNTLLLPSLRAFLRRTLDLPGHNVVTALVGDFTRTLDAGHAGTLVANVWGKHVRQGTSGNFLITGDYNTYAPRNGVRTGAQQLWALIAAAAGVTSTPFGANPHPFV